MELPLAANELPELIALAEVDSTNKELIRRLDPKAPEFFSVTALSQVGGLGRLGRTWITEPGKSMALSMLLRPQTEAARNWITIMAGLAIRAVAVDLGAKALLKWPNDLLVEGKKLAGILAEVAEGNQVVLGIGFNMLPQENSPETAVCLQELQIDISLDELLAAIAKSIRGYWEVLNSDPVSAIAKFQEELHDACLTLGTKVRAELPGGKNLYGVATSIDDSGRLIIETPEPVALAAADVWHLRN